FFKVKPYSLHIALATLLINNLYGQDVVMSQFYAAQLYLNPALTGIAYGPRFSVNYRNQWPAMGGGFNAGYTTYMGAFDMHVDRIRSGIGLMIIADQMMNNIFGNYYVSASFSPQIKFKRNMALKMGVSGTYIHRRLKWSELQFSDMINPYTGFFDATGNPNPTGEAAPGRLSLHRGDIAAGFVFFTQKLYLGFAVNNFIMNKENFSDAVEARTPMRFTLHFGGSFPIKNKRSYRHNIYLSPNVLIANQARNVQINGGLLLGIDWAYFGAQFRYVINNPESAIMVVGVKKGKFRFGYSYDYPVSTLINRTGGAHELTFTFNIAGDDNSVLNKNTKGYISCPTILNF
ncbi:MAG: PorP/SprF family type IX secretion system membrane protein, partial [Chitinophagales bacterium]|nr:PorP/SprF family type IX secretion system membrane protein [Chitinophagales bacterium]